MKTKVSAIALLMTLFLTFQTHATTPQIVNNNHFNLQKDLLLLQCDCKTDVDDIHVIAAFATLVASPKYKELNYLPVVGTYGIQKGLYVPPENLMRKAFGTKWVNAHKNPQKALKRVLARTKRTLSAKGDIWIAEAGQSDFTAKLIKAVQKELPKIDTQKRIHIVQHSNWNEKETTPEDLNYVKMNTDYQKIPDGNRKGNGTPGFQLFSQIDWKSSFTDKHQIEIWELSRKVAKKYVGKEGRYNNKSIAKGGFDFSDLAEVCWVLGINDTPDVQTFFKVYAQ